MLLALDTATSVTSVALLREHAVIDERVDADASAGEVCVGLIDAMFADNELDRSDQTLIAVGVGPGPYTSTRVGLAIARAIGLGLDVPVVGICSHDAIAAQFVARHAHSTDADGIVEDEGRELAAGVAVNAGDFIVTTDARRREVYWALYDASGKRKMGPQVGKPADVVAAYPMVSTYVGNGFARYPDLPAEEFITPSARWIAELALRELERGSQIPHTAHPVVDHVESGTALVSPEQAVFAPYPLYIRRPDAVEPVIKS